MRNWAATFETMPHERRFVRFNAPSLQLQLALAVLGVTLLFAALFAANSFAAYGRLMSAAFSEVPDAYLREIALQSRQYTHVSVALLLAYGLALVAVCGSWVNRLTGPAVALERHVRALRNGDYRSRVRLRGGGAVHAGLARQLNDLAEQLEDEALRRRTPR